MRYDQFCLYLLYRVELKEKEHYFAIKLSLWEIYFIVYMHMLICAH